MANRKHNIRMHTKFIHLQRTQIELRAFHTKEINDRYKNVKEKKPVLKDLIQNRISERLVFWDNTFREATDYIVQRPTKEVLNVRLKLIESHKDCTEVMLKSFKEYLLNMLDKYYDLGNSDAFMELANELLIFTKSEPYKTFKLKGNIEDIWWRFNTYQVIDYKTSLDGFTKAFSGNEITEIGLIELKCAKTTFAGLIQLLNDNNCFDYFPSNFHKITENITGEKQFKNALGKWRAFGTFKNESKMRKLVKSINEKIDS